MRALVRAYAGEPLERVVTKIAARVIYAANRESAAGDAQLSGVGFPPEDVFEFEEVIYRRLCAQWAATGRTDPALWGEARPYREAVE